MAEWDNGVAGGATHLRLDQYDCCAFCGLHEVAIFAHFPNGKRERLWLSGYVGEDEVDDLKEDVIKACEAVGLPTEGIKGRYWEWRAEGPAVECS